MTADKKSNNSREAVETTEELELNSFHSSRKQIQESPSYNAPTQKKAVSFGISQAEIKEEFDSPSQEGSKVYRRTSVSQKPTFEPGALNLKNPSITPLDNFNKSILQPPIPESLPTTPGFELRGDSYFDQELLSTRLVPPQQQQQLPIHKSNFELEHAEREVVAATSGMTLSNPPKNKWRLISLMLWVGTVGLSDGAPGALLPRVEEYYGINYTIVSLIWMSNAVGFVLIALFAHKLEGWFGKRIMITCGSLAQVVMYSFVGPGSKFGLVVFGFFFGGVGVAIGLSQHNIFLSRFTKASHFLGLYHGSYGIGATVSPLIATAMVDSGVKWSYYFFILLGLSILNFINQWYAFEGCNEDLKPWDHFDQSEAKSEDNSPVTTPAEEADKQLSIIGGTSVYASDFERVNKDTRSGNAPVATESVEPIIPKGNLQLAIKNVRTWLISFFVLFYQGAEVSIGGWVVTFLEDYRGGSPSSTGYIVSGFWGGLTIGRLFLTPLVDKYIGGKRGVFLLLLSSIVCCILTWVVEVIIVEAVFVSFLGLFVGPIYPLMITVVTRILPRKIQFISLTIMTAFGSSGGAIFPFIVGLVSQYAGAFVVMPFFIALFSATVVIWYLLPNPDRNILKHSWEKVW